MATIQVLLSRANEGWEERTFSRDIPKRQSSSACERYIAKVFKIGRPGQAVTPDYPTAQASGPGDGILRVAATGSRDLGAHAVERVTETGIVDAEGVTMRSTFL